MFEDTGTGDNADRLLRRELAINQSDEATTLEQEARPADQPGPQGADPLTPDGSETAEQPRLFEEPELPPESETAADTDRVGLLDRIFAFEGEPSPIYLASLLSASGLLVLAAALDYFPWLGSIVGVVVLLATMFRGGRWVAAVGCFAIAVVVVVNAWPEEQTLADVRGTGGGIPAVGADAVDEAPEGSLGFELGEVTALWNEIDQGPGIRRGLVRTPERGRFDGFVYQFDEDSSLAGAYDPDDEYVYALLASVRLRHDSAEDFYLHLCYMVHPFSQECIDGYLEKGLGGGSLESFVGVEHSAEWVIEDVTWRLDIAGNVQQLRALGDRSG